MTAVKSPVLECRSCHAPIRWVTMRGTRKPNPLDAEPTPNGNVQILDDGTAWVLRKRDLVVAREAGEVLYTSHFGTCVDAKMWRERGKAKAKEGQTT
jgi:hypothetical protein